MSVADFSPTGWPDLLASACLFMFYLALCWLMLVRPSPATRTTGVLPSIIAFAGSYVPWAIVMFAPTDASEGQKLASAVLLLIGAGLMVVVICHLGRSYSIVPQARRLVRTGPYAVIRNPLKLRWSLRKAPSRPQVPLPRRKRASPTWLMPRSVPSQKRDSSSLGTLAISSSSCELRSFRKATSRQSCKWLWSRPSPLRFRSASRRHEPEKSTNCVSYARRRICGQK